MTRVSTHRRWRHIAGGVAVLALLAGACSGDDDAAEPAADEPAADEPAADEPADEVEVTQGGSVLDDVLARGELRCGTRDALPGFAVLTDTGDHVGFDSDFCRVIAAAVLGDANAVEHVDLETPDRFTALQSGEIDVLVRNTTWTAGRDGGEAATFMFTTFYDGQGMMVASDSGFAGIADMDGVTVCVAQGTTTEGNAAATASRLGVDWEIRPFLDTDLIQQAFEAGQCDGWSADASQLLALRSVNPAGPDALTILPEIFSKEPLAPAVADGDSQWAQIVNWAVMAPVIAEELGIDSTNVDSFSETDNISILRFLGLEITDDDGSAVLDPGLGLPTDFGYQVVSQVGNYAEIFGRNLTPIGLSRGPNSLWTVPGGLLYTPPYR